MTETALDILNAERARQRADAHASFMANLPDARVMADAIRERNRMVLVGMGGSHFLNRIVEPIYRSIGIEATAHTASEILEMPLPERRRVVILTSQSGQSTEIKTYLERRSAGEKCFGLTLEKASLLAKTVPSLVGVGGSERSFAAARSILITLALHAALLDHLGQKQLPAMDWLATSRDIETSALVEFLSGATSFILVGPTHCRGIVESAGLMLMETAHVPVIALEAGQFRHGPIESLNKTTGIILLRMEGVPMDGGAEIADFATRASSPIVALDLGAKISGPTLHRVVVPTGPGIAWQCAAVLACQALMIDLATKRVANFGEPRFSRKVM